MARVSSRSYTLQSTPLREGGKAIYAGAGMLFYPEKTFELKLGF